MKVQVRSTSVAISIKASGIKTCRMVIDYRKLNEKTIDKSPIPNIIDLLNKLGRANFFTALDLASS